MFPWQRMILTTRTRTLTKQNQTQLASLQMKHRLPVKTLCTTTPMMTLPISWQGLNPPREQWDVAAPINFQDIDGITYLAHQMDAAFSSMKEIETPLGMDDTGMMWRWADVGSGQMPRAPPMYPTKTIGTGGAQQPATSQVDYTALYRWIVSNLAWLSQYDTAYVFVDNRELPSQNHPDYWPYFAPWIKSRCEVIGPYKEKTHCHLCPDLPRYRTASSTLHMGWRLCP